MSTDSQGGQLQPEDTLDDRGVDDILDEGISPPEKPRGVTAKGVTAWEQEQGETIEDRLAQEEPDIAVEDSDPLVGTDEPPAYDDEVGDERSGRLVAPDEGLGPDEEADLVAEDVGIDGAAASAEEAAIHVVDDEG
jgi:hypothetical protein